MLYTIVGAGIGVCKPTYTNRSWTENARVLMAIAATTVRERIRRLEILLD